MLADPQDTIVALATAPGSGGRGVVRLSGSEALKVVASVFKRSATVALTTRGCHAGEIRLPGIASALPADLLVWLAPRSYTGQLVTELHTLSCPPLLDLLIACLLDAGARAAQAGEFTLRAFLGGKLDLTQAEAVLGVIEAGSRSELRQALKQLAGGVAHLLQGLRNDLLDLLAEVEAGLDFSEEDIRFIETDELLNRLAMGLARITLLQKQLDQRSTGERPFRAVLVGRPNAGKSSLFNALTGEAALVAPEEGTTRDYLVGKLQLDGPTIDLVDTAGWRAVPESIEEQAQSLGNEQAAVADVLLLCLEAGLPMNDKEHALAQRDSPPVLLVATKCDEFPPPPGLLATSAATGAGLDALRQLLGQRVRARPMSALAPSMSRCRHHVHACLDHLRQAHTVVLNEEPPELLALELRGALDQLGEMVGAVHTEDLLERIFSRFCIGK